MTKLINNKFKLTFYLMLMFSTIMAMSSNSWMSMWMSLEINMMSFIPLMMNTPLNLSTNAMIKYFLTQAVSSSMLIISLMMLKMQNNYASSNLIYTLMTTSLLFKLSAAPLHWWLPSMINEISWINCLILLTWQKIIPMYMINTMEFKSTMITFCASFSAMLGSISGLNQTSLKMILTYSSITHTGWMLHTMNMNKIIMSMYLLIYSLLILSVTIMCKTLNMNYLSQMFLMNNKKNMMKMMMTMMFLSMSGLPPFISFTPKIFTLMMMINNKMLMETMILLMSTLISLKFYMNPLITSLMLNYYNNKSTMLNMKLNKLNLLIIINLSINLILIKYLNQIMI
uniref:NADH dehydrogenase subunit 2 n=1 Tax=Blasticotoma filiceti TaxID=1141352 RepID=UPI002200E0F0|nr:NADH dehydrogenase subunit 2 [Blasticotoma filiceti]UXW93438.1 NADH dehydrogenase subunit 2 [Blasticotoma filiceti]